MKYIPDSEIESLSFTRNPDNLRIASFPRVMELDLLLSFVWYVTWKDLAFFSECTAKSTGCGFEVTGSRYDDEFDLDEERWTGVQISNSFDDEPIVLSTQAYENFCLRLLDFAEAVAKTENQPILRTAQISPPTRNVNQS